MVELSRVKGGILFSLNPYRAFVVLTQLVLIGQLAYAQDYKAIDSLNRQLNVKTTDSLKAIYLNDLAWEWRIHDGDKALEYADLALEISIQDHNPHQIATSLNRKGEVYRLRGQYREALDQFEMALTIENEIGNLFGMARASGLMGTLYRNLGENDSALYYAQKSLLLFKELGKTPAVGRSHTRIAAIFKDKTQYDSARAHYDLAMKIQLALEDEDDLANTYLSLGNLFKDRGDIDLAMSQYQRSLEIRNSLEIKDSTNQDYEKAKVLNAVGNAFYLRYSYDSALYYLFNSLALKKKANARRIMDVSYNNIGNVYASTKAFDSALIYYHKSLEIKEENQDYAGLAMVHANIGMLHMKSKNNQTALRSFKKSLAYSEGRRDFTILIETYSNISDIYEELKNPDSALAYNNEYLLIRDSLYLAVKSAGRYETERSMRIQSESQEQIKAAELESVRAENELKKMIIWTISLGLLLLILGVIFYYRNRLQQQMVLIAKKDKSIVQQQVHKLLKDQEINAINAMLEGQEGERKRIAQDLHDRLGSMLSVVKIHFKSVEDNIQEPETDGKIQYRKANQLLDEACEEVRKIAHDMVSGVLTKFGLIPALKSLGKSVEETGQLEMKVLDFGFDEERLDYDTEINLYRIVQELLSNVLKHADAREMSVQLIKKNDNLNMVVEDDGVGFELNGNSGGIGLQNINSRVEKLQGEMNIDSGKGAGTTITIDFPLTN